MSTSKHLKGGSKDEGGLGADTPRPPSDLERNPGIGASKGRFGRGTGPAVLQGENTDEGDIANDAGSKGGVDPDLLGRTNK